MGKTLNILNAYCEVEKFLHKDMATREATIEYNYKQCKNELYSSYKGPKTI
jgi:hypothetical protein